MLSTHAQKLIDELTFRASRVDHAYRTSGLLKAMKKWYKARSALCNYIRRLEKQAKVK